MVDFRFAMLDYVQRFGQDSMDTYIHPVSDDLLKAAKQHADGREERIWFHVRWERYINDWSDEESNAYRESIL